MSHRRIFALALTGALLFSLSGCATKEESTYVAPEGVAVQVSEIARNTIATTNRVSGKVVADDDTSVFVPTNALCTAVYVSQGDPISAGQRICTLDMASTLASYNAANVSYQASVQSYADQEALFNSQIALAETNLATTERLLEIGAASQLELDNAKLQLQQLQITKTSTLSQLEAGMQSGKSSLAQLSSLLEHVDSAGNVIAPVSGTISSLTAVESSYISASAPVAVISGAEQMKLTVSVSESLVPKLSVGSEVDVTVSSANVSFKGNIRSVDPAANPQTKLYGVTISIPADVSGLMSGMFADVTFHTDVSSDAVVVPSSAILTSNGVQYVYVVEGENAKYVEIETGLTGNGITEVTSGLTAGQKIVTVGQNYLSDGSLVRVITEED